METITIEYQPNFKEKLMTFLNSFNSEDVKIIKDENDVVKDEAFFAYQKYLHNELKKIDSGESQMYTLEELDAMLEETIAKYED